jgi:hypothetical protein
MGQPFRIEAEGIGVDLGDIERDLLTRLLIQTADLLDPGDEATDDADPLAQALGLGRLGVEDPDADLVAEPEDPAVARLLPRGHREDDAAAAEYRRLTEYGLRVRKRESLRMAEQALRRDERPVLTVREAQALVKGFTDIRLVLGQRLGLRDDTDTDRLQEILVTAGAEEEHPLAGFVLLYDLLTWWQEHLVAVLQRVRRPPDASDGRARDDDTV